MGPFSRTKVVVCFHHQSHTWDTLAPYLKPLKSEAHFFIHFTTFITLKSQSVILFACKRVKNMHIYDKNLSRTARVTSTDSGRTININWVICHNSVRPRSCLRMRQITWHVNNGWKQLYVLNPLLQFAYSLYSLTYGATRFTTTIKGFRGESPPLGGLRF